MKLSKFISSILVLGFFVFPLLGYSQTRPIVPREAGEGSIGKQSKVWDSGYFSNSITLGNQTITEWPDTSTTLICLETNMNQGDTIKVPGKIYAIYDNAPYRREDSILFGSTNISIVERENWIGTATTLTVATANTNAGVIAGSFSEKALPNGCWMYLENKEEPYWITGLDSSGNISWISTSKNQLDAGTYNISMVSPVAQVENEGLCYGTPDGTQTFSKFANAPSRSYYGMTTIDGKTFFLAPNNSYICKSIDGGQIWKDISVSRQWRQITTIDNQIVWVAVYGNHIYKNLNGGEGDWIQVTTNLSTRNWYGITTADNINLFASVHNGAIYKSTDGGMNWSVTSSGNKAWRYLKTIDGTNIFACVNDGNVWKSEDSGTSWNNIGFVSNGLWTIETIDNTNLYASIIRYAIYKSMDSGRTWNKWTTSNTANWWYGLATVDGKTVFGTVYTTAGGIYYNAPQPNVETSSLTNYYTTIFNVESNNFQGFSELFDFAFDQTFSDVYFTFKTSEDEYSIFDVNLEWTPIVKKTIDNQYAVRTTNMVLEVVDPSISSFSEAITCAMTNYVGNQKNHYNYEFPQVDEKLSNIINDSSTLTFSITFYNRNTKNYPLESFDTDANFISDKYNIRYYDNIGYDIYVKELDDEGQNVESSIYRKDANQANMRVFYFKNKYEE